MLVVAAPGKEKLALVALVRAQLNSIVHLGNYEYTQKLPQSSIQESPSVEQDGLVGTVEAVPKPVVDQLQVHRVVEGMGGPHHELERLAEARLHDDSQAAGHSLMISAR